MKTWFQIALVALVSCCALILPGSVQGQDTVDEALWLRNCAVSPDGSEIAFTYQGDIWIVGSKGGEARLLTMHKGYDTQPRWSPDGSKVAFTSHRHGHNDVFVIPARGGRPVRLTYHSNSDIVQGWEPDGSAVLFTSVRAASAETSLFPSRIVAELWSIPATGGRPHPVITDATRQATVSPDGKTILYVPRRDYENYWRKFQRVAATDNIWLYDRATGDSTKITTFNGDDHEPVWEADGKHFFYVSDESGWGNVWRSDLSGKSASKITSHTGDYVRFLSVTADGSMAVYSFEGALYTCDVESRTSTRLEVKIRADNKANDVQRKSFSGQASEYKVAASGKEIAFIVRGEVFACDMKGHTRRLTDTPERERHVSWSHDGNSVIYSSERDGSWNLYKVERVREEEKLFSKATLLKETPVYVNAEECFYPSYSPDDTELAYIADRKALKILNLESGETRTVCPDVGYSYTDGDHAYQWSPDGKWLAHDYMPPNRWTGEVAVSPADGSGTKIVTMSGYEEWGGQWTSDGKQIFFASNRAGLVSHGGHGTQWDAYGVFLQKSEHQSYIDSEKDDEDEDEEADYQDSQRRRRKPPKDDGDDDGEEDEDGKDEESKPKEPVVVTIEFEGLPDRVRRISPHSSKNFSFAPSPDGSKVVYFAENTTGKYDLWINDQKTKKNKMLAPLGLGKSGELQWDKKGKSIFFLGKGGSLFKIQPKGGKVKPIRFTADMTIDTPGEFANWFEHIWRQTYEKFYEPGMNGIDWKGRKAHYASMLPYITEPTDFAELLSEMLGELNASHTGCSYRYGGNGDATGDLGLFYDWSYQGDGLKIKEVIENGPLDRVEFNLQPGEIVWSINGEAITAGMNIFPMLNHSIKKNTVLRVGAADVAADQRREIVVKPVPFTRTFSLLYPRWVKRREEIVKRESDGRLGYVHVRSMSAGSYRSVYMNLFGKYYDREALIVDTRFNGGGWLHDDLATLLSGKEYCWFSPRGRPTGSEPAGKWTKPSVVLVCEANYSDAHFFPWAYTTLEIGRTVGMPLPGTATAVWWERMPDGKMVFGIPMVGILDKDGKYLENQEYVPDVVVENLPADSAKGLDKQLERAVQELLK